MNSKASDMNWIEITVKWATLNDNNNNNNSNTILSNEFWIEWKKKNWMSNWIDWKMNINDRDMIEQNWTNAWILLKKEILSNNNEPHGGL